MALPIKYRKSSEILVNYTFADLLANVGYVSLYGLDDEAGNKTLVRQEIESSDAYTDYAKIGAGDEKRGEEDFDYTFLSTQLVKGKLYVSVTDYSPTSDGQFWTKIRIYHYDGATETEIGTQQTTGGGSGAAGTDEGRRVTCVFDVDKKFSKGDILRVNIEIWGSGAASTSSRLYHDGANRDYSIVSVADQGAVALKSNLIVLVPFDLGGKF